MSDIPFNMNLESPTFFGHDMFPNQMYRRLHARQHTPLDVHTLGLIARIGAQAHNLCAKRNNHDGLTALGVKLNKNELEINLDVGLFAAEELTVKVVGDSIVIEGKHEERADDHGFITRHFVRRYPLPKEYEADRVLSTLSLDGVLTVRAKQKHTQANKEVIVPITKIGPSDFFIKGGHQQQIDVQKNGEKHDESEQPKEN